MQYNPLDAESETTNIIGWKQSHDMSSRPFSNIVFDSGYGCWALTPETLLLLHLCGGHVPLSIWQDLESSVKWGVCESLLASFPMRSNGLLSNESTLSHGRLVQP